MLHPTVSHSTGKDSDGVSISFEDGTVTNQFLSWKAFRQLLAMKISREKPGAKIPLAVSVGPEAATV